MMRAHRNVAFRVARWRALYWPVLLAAVLLAGCGGGSQLDNQSSTQPGWFDELPHGLKGASTTTQVDGSAHVFASTDIQNIPPVAILDAQDTDYSFAIYAFDPPPGEGVLSITCDFSALDSECWLGFANYTNGSWEWQQIQPGAEQEQVYFSYPFDYLSLDGNVYWAVVAARGHSVQVDRFTVDYSSIEMPVFYPAPTGETTVDSASLTPQVVLLPELHSTGNSIAPVVVYTKSVDTQSQLILGYYGGGVEWRQQALLEDRSCALPQARWLDDAGEAAVVVYDVTNGQLLDLRFNQWWELQSETAIPLPDAPGLGTPTHISLDVDPATGLLGVGYAFNDDPARVYFSQEGGTGWGAAMLASEYAGETIPGLSFKFDPAGGEPWLAFTHGVASYDTELSVDYALEYGRFNGTGWELTAAGRTESPLWVDLGFDGTTPQIVFSEVRQGVVTIGSWPLFYDIDVPLLTDVFAGSYNGSAWTYTRVFESDLDSSFSFTTMTLTLTLNLAPACGWAKASELAYNNIAGSVDLAIEIVDGSPQVTPTGGSLTNSVHYMVKGGGGAYSPSAYFTSRPGITLSWDERAGRHAAAYVLAEQVDVENILGGSLETENTLLFWMPE